jgi:hypothetical protein
MCKNRPLKLEERQRDIETEGIVSVLAAIVSTTASTGSNMNIFSCFLPVSIRVWE